MKNKRYRAGDPHPTRPGFVFKRYDAGAERWCTLAARAAQLARRRKHPDSLDVIRRRTRAKSDAAALKKAKDPWRRGDIHPETGLQFLCYDKQRSLTIEKWLEPAEFRRRLEARSLYCKNIPKERTKQYQRKYRKSPKGEAHKLAYRATDAANHRRCRRKKKVNKMTKSLLGLGDKLEKI